jgi:hypothetical protein
MTAAFCEIRVSIHSICVKPFNFQIFFVMKTKSHSAIAVCCADRLKLFRPSLHAAATEKHFSDPSCTLRRRKNIFQTLPARCGNRKTLFNLFLHAAGTNKPVSDPPCTLRRRKNTFQTVPARCRDK